MSETEKITINLSVVDLGKIDLLVEEGFYSNRTDLIRTAVRNQLERHATEVEKAIVQKDYAVGIMVYTQGGLEATYEDGEIIIRQGEVGNSMYVIQQGKVEVLSEKDGQEIELAIRKEGDFVGEMAIFERDVRSATIRALGQVRVLTIDKKNFLRRIHEDPSIAFRLVEIMSRLIRELSEENARLTAGANKIKK